jgi:ADP-ribosyl-[dinitrogen reductase] hydrolase
MLYTCDYPCAALTVDSAMNATPSTKRASDESNHRLSKALAGVLIGTAVGDALGLPMEGLTPQRQQRLFPLPLRHRLIGHRGMVSDDTEHTLMVAQALLQHPEDATAFQRSLAWKLRWWILALPAGVGLATLRAILKLWIGFPPHKSGVFSAGNGPAMRSAVLGVFFAHEPAKRRKFVHAATTLTHSDPRAEVAAAAVAEAAAWAAGLSPHPDGLLDALATLSDNPEWQSIVAKMKDALSRSLSVSEFAAALGLTRGVTGYAFHTAPIAIYATLRHADDFPAALTSVIACGGDTDTVGAIAGALLGAQVTTTGIPEHWRTGIIEWPRSLGLLERVADRLSQQRDTPALGPVRYAWPGVALRNVLFLFVVLAHGFRRLFPPY